ncbi:CHAD domain-containing protein [Xanthobacter sp. KR7-65]|uniref:thiolase family protein n=1 Tax=Xanthobacter sp. KR7-65 TaxID=3156612 RepID=UPI0032B56658
MSPVAILAARRTAVVPRGGAFRDIAVHDLAAALVGPLLADAGLAPDAVDEVILGNALSGGGNVARVAALAAGLPEAVPALTLDTQCCSGLDAIRIGAARIAAGEARYVIAGGAESFSRAPLRAHRPATREGALRFYRQPAFTPWPEREIALAASAAAIAQDEGITRAAQEAFAMESHRRALAAPPSAAELVPVAGLGADPFARQLSPALLARLPVLAGAAVHGVTAATTAVEADAAALVLLGPAGEGPVGITAALARGGDPLVPALAPVAAVAVLCARCAVVPDEIEHVELMEAYAVQALATLRRLGLDAARVNAGGGALARGHPIGASGAVLAVRAFHRLLAGEGRALVAIAGAGGIASAMLLTAGGTRGSVADLSRRSSSRTKPLMDAAIEDPARSVPPPPAAGAALAQALSATLDRVEAAATDPDPVEMVHDARKAMKQYRALLRLIPDELATVTRHRTAAVAREMSSARDQAAALEALGLLDAEGLILAGDHEEARAALGGPADDGGAAEPHRAALAHFLAEARAELDGALGEAARAADVGAALAKGYRQARRAHFDTPEAMHEARKRVVTHRYQMSFIAEAFGGRGGKRARRTQKLRDLFGAYQDIETLRPMLAAAGDALAEGTRERLGFALARAQKRLRKQAMKQHAALFRRGTRAFIARYGDIL